MSKQTKSQSNSGESPMEPKRWSQPPKYAPWRRTRGRLKIIRKNLTKTDAEIGRIFGITRAAVYALRVRFGIAKKRANIQRKEGFISLVRKMRSGLTPQEMASKLELPEVQARYYGNFAGYRYRFLDRKEKTNRYWNNQLKSLPSGLTIKMTAQRLGISYHYTFFLCKKFHHEVLDGRSSKPRMRVPGCH